VNLAPRLARRTELAELSRLMDASIRAFLGTHLDAARVDASFDIMGLDTQLIEDGTYFVVECGDRIAGCGGWSRRATLFGGDHADGRNARLLDPATEPARVRAMYTHPDFARRGVGRLVLSLCEAAAAREGFQSLELAATVAGEPLYLACGFSILERLEVPTSKGVTVPLARMTKALRGRPMEHEVCIFMASGEIEAQQVRGFLTAAGVPCELRGESLRKTHGLTIDGLGLVHVVVSEEDEEQARALLASAERGVFRIGEDAQVQE
jgi:GNAT superfamily N-acetyltransferase